MTPLQKGAAFVGVPYSPRGRDPAGWDCWGCVRWGRWAVFDRHSPDWSDAYTAADFASVSQLAETTARLVRERLSAWREVPAQAGAVVLLTIFDRPAHVGLMLTGDEMLHAFGRAATTIERVDSLRWSGRVVGFFDA